VHIHVEVREEACPLGLAPTSSTTAALAMGDALAIAMLQARGFTARDFARRPSGRVTGPASVASRSTTSCTPRRHAGRETGFTGRRGVVEMTRSGLGLTAVVDAEQRVIGIFTDGDLRRVFERNHDIRSACMADVMTPQLQGPSACDLLAAEALRSAGSQDQRAAGGGEDRA